MADGTSIEWTDATWQIVTGCSVVSPGCTNCYAMRLAGTRLQHHPSRAGLTAKTKAGPVWNGKVRFNADWLKQPLQWKKPRDIFVAAHGDLFHDGIERWMLVRVFAVMAIARRHRFQVLTKRADNMRRFCLWLQTAEGRAELEAAARELGHTFEFEGWSLLSLPLPNVWLGVSAEDQPRADERIPLLLSTPAAVRWISAEPLLGPLDLAWALSRNRLDIGAGFLKRGRFSPGMEALRPLSWVISGGESGPNSRPAHPDWFRSIRDQCAAAGVPYFHKQNGAWAPGECADKAVTRTERVAKWDGERWDYYSLTPRISEELHLDDAPDVYLLGKKAAGAKLDGREHRDFPL